MVRVSCRINLREGAGVSCRENLDDISRQEWDVAPEMESGSEMSYGWDVVWVSCRDPGLEQG